MLERLATIRHTTAFFTLSIGVFFLAVILSSVQQSSLTSSPVSRELIPHDWESVSMPRYSFGYPSAWNLSRTEDGFTFTDDDNRVLVVVADVTSTRADVLTRLDQSLPLSTADFFFADQPARRYLYADHDTYIVAVDRRAYRLDVFGDSPDLDLFLATVRFF